MTSSIRQPLNPVRRVWSEDRTVLNGWISAPSVLGAEVMASAGWDSITIDMQHGTADYTDLLHLLPVIEKAGVATLVRVPWLDEATVMRALDAGALGIIAPMIESASDAKRLVQMCLYPPLGGRSFGPIRARFAWPGVFSMDSSNAEILILAMIETQAGMAALDEILEVPGLTGIYIGPGDLGASYGFAPTFDREEEKLVDVIKTIRQKTADAGLACCLHCGTPEYAAKAAGWGMDLVTIGSDARFMEAAARDAVTAFKEKI